MAEGAGVLVLETRAHAEARGAEVLAVVAGAGASADAHHQTAPPEDGGGAILAMERAMQDAGMAPDELSHINAHGTSTPLNDSAESRAVRSIFGDDAPPITSTKGVTGHLLGAAGAVEAAFGILSLRDGLIPPTANHRRKGEGIDLDVVAGDPRESSRRAMLSNSFGFGGQNAALVLTTPDA